MVVSLEGHIQKRGGFFACMFRGRGACFVVPDGEYSLELAAVRERMSSDKHLNDETAQTPNVSLLGMGCLFYNFRCHPIDATL